MPKNESDTAWRENQVLIIITNFWIRSRASLSLEFFHLLYTFLEMLVYGIVKGLDQIRTPAKDSSPEANNLNAFLLQNGLQWSSFLLICN